MPLATHPIVVTKSDDIEFVTEHAAINLTGYTVYFEIIGTGAATLDSTAGTGVVIAYNNSTLASTIIVRLNRLQTAALGPQSTYKLRWKSPATAEWLDGQIETVLGGSIKNA